LRIPLVPGIHWTYAMGADWRWFYSVPLSNIGHISDAAVTVEPVPGTPGSRRRYLP